jgi:hypothetical protein
VNTVIFACVHSAGRSQMAAALLNQLADPEKVRGLAAGADPGDRVHPSRAPRPRARRRRGVEQGKRLSARENTRNVAAETTAVAEPPRERRASARSRAATVARNGSGEMFGVYGLRQVCPDAGHECPADVLRESRGHDDRDGGERRVGLHRRDHLPPVDDRHREIGDDDARKLARSEPRERRFTAERALDHESGGFQVERQRIEALGVVVDDEYRVRMGLIARR